MRRRQGGDARYVLPGADDFPGPVHSQPQTNAETPTKPSSSPPRIYRQKHKSQSRSHRTRRFISVSAADFVLLPVVDPTDGSHNILGPISATARPPSYDFTGLQQQTTSMLISHTQRQCQCPCTCQQFAAEPHHNLPGEVSNTCGDRRNNAPPELETHPFLIIDTSHADNIVRIVNEKHAEANITGDCAPSLHCGGSRTLHNTARKPDRPRDCRTTIRNAISENNPASTSHQHSSPAEPNVDIHKQKSAPQSGFRSLALDVGNNTFLTANERRLANDSRNVTKRHSLVGPLTNTPTRNSQPGNVDDQVLDHCHSAGLIPVVPAFVSSHARLNSSALNYHPQNDLDPSSSHGHPKQKPTEILHIRTIDESLYDIDAWSDAVDTLGTETWPYISSSEGMHSLSADGRNSPWSSSLFPTDARSDDKPPCQRIDDLNQNSSYNDRRNPTHLVRAEKCSTSVHAASAASKPGFQHDIAVTTTASHSEVFSENRSLSGALGARRVISGRRSSSADGKSSDYSVDLDFKFQDADDEFPKSTCATLSPSTAHENVRAEEPANPPTNCSTSPSLIDGQKHKFSELSLAHNSAVRANMDRHYLTAGYLYLGHPPSDGERHSVGDVMVCGSQKLVPFSPIDDPEDSNNSLPGGTGAGRRLLGLGAHRISDESDDAVSVPSCSFYANDDYDKFCIRNSSPLKPKRNSYLNRILTGEVRESVQHRPSPHSLETPIGSSAESRSDHRYNSSPESSSPAKPESSTQVPMNDTVGEKVPKTEFCA